MKKYMFKCQTCKTLMSLETEIDSERIHMSPPCICGKSRMLSLTSYEYAYGNLQHPQRNGWDE